MAKLVIVLLVFVLPTILGTSEYDNELGVRIVGGTDAPEGGYPYQVSIRTTQNEHFCGGSIINEYWILTAAHCLFGQDFSYVIVVVGTNYLNYGGIAYQISNAFWNRYYNPENCLNDVGVIRVYGSIHFTPSVQPIVLSDTEVAPGTSCIVTGWGFTYYPSETPPNALQQIQLTTISIPQCQASVNYFPVRDTNICTFNGEGQGTCRGDSGGPLVCGGVQAGIVSFGIPCAVGSPDVFTNVAMYRDWIRGITGT